MSQNDQKSETATVIYQEDLDLLRKVIDGYRDGSYVFGMKGGQCVYICHNDDGSTSRCAAGAMFHHHGISDKVIAGLNPQNSAPAIMDDLKLDMNEDRKIFWHKCQVSHDNVASSIHFEKRKVPVREASSRIASALEIVLEENTKKFNKQKSEGESE